MKALMIYYTMGGRTKGVAETLGASLTGFDVDFIRLEIIGKFVEKIKKMDKLENGDFSLFEKQMEGLNAESYDLILIGMPTYGNLPPKTFNEVVGRIENLDKKRTAVFSTARFTGGKNLEYMKGKIEQKGGDLVASRNFRNFIRIGKKSAKDFGNELVSIY